MTLHLEQAGPISVVMTSARDNVEAELHTRVILSPADESGDQTIRAARKAAARVSGQPLARQSRTTREDWIAFHRLLELSGLLWARGRPKSSPRLLPPNWRPC